MHEAGADIVVTNAKEAVEAIEGLLADVPATRATLSRACGQVARSGFSPTPAIVRLKPDPQATSQPSAFCGSPVFSQVNTRLCQRMRCT